MSTSLLWLRRDLRVDDHPALLAALEAADDVVPVFVVDPALTTAAGQPRLRFLRSALDWLTAQTDGALVLRSGDPRTEIPRLVAETDATSVHISAETEPFGARRDADVEAALPVPLVATGSPYAVTPGRIRTRQGGPYKVFTPFRRAWQDHGWRAPAASADRRRWRRDIPGLNVARLLPAPSPHWRDPHTLWTEFLNNHLDGYAEDRNRPDLDATSRLSPHLKFGTVHPRTLLADMTAHPAATTDDGARFHAELAWREFYADVTHHHPSSLDSDLTDALAGMPYDDPDDPDVAQRVDAWRHGRTGYPMVDAGMRQLLAEGWMHNRVRMLTASFLTKDLHVWWPVGAQWFMEHLIDGDPASNSHGWQWTAGTGTDASPYFRVFNPITQGLRFDPDGTYVRRWIPELAHLPGKHAHTPWETLDGLAHGYPERIVDHATEREEALRRLEQRR